MELVTIKGTEYDWKSIEVKIDGKAFPGLCLTRACLDAKQQSDRNKAKAARKARRAQR